MDVDGVADVCNVYRGPHPVLFAGDCGLGRRMKAFAKRGRLTLEGRVGPFGGACLCENQEPVAP